MGTILHGQTIGGSYTLYGTPLQFVLGDRSEAKKFSSQKINTGQLYMGNSRATDATFVRIKLGQKQERNENMQTFFPVY